jgi:hypothetical protein
MPLQDVYIKALFKICSITAKFTRVELTPAMADHVIPKVAICFKLFIAFGTLERFSICKGTCIHCIVTLQRQLIGEFFLAKITLKWNFLCMPTHMNGKVGKSCKSFCTKITLVVGLI